MSMISQICVSYLGSLPLYQLLVFGDDLSSERSLADARKYVVEAILHGIARES